MAGEYCIETFTGRALDPFDPDPNMIYAVDIDHALHHINRFGGHAARPISVAEHSIFVACLLAASGHGPSLQLQGLCHDAAEAYMGDVPRPIKHRFPEFEVAEERLLRGIFGILGVPWWTSQMRKTVKWADDIALAYEAREWMPCQIWSPEKPDPALIEAAKGRMASGPDRWLDWLDQLRTEVCEPPAEVTPD